MHKFVFDKTLNKITLQGSYLDLLDLMKKDAVMACNTMLQQGIRSDEKSDWRGGTYSEVFKPVDMKPFIESLDKLKSNPNFKFLKPSTGWASLRRRTSSEYDGDYDIDKKWDYKPFNSTSRVKSPIPHVTVRANLSLNCNYSAEQLNNYGTLVWAIVQLLESRGIRVSVIGMFETDINSKVRTTAIDTLVKDSVKYISPQALASVFTSNYVRRVMFNGLVLAADEKQSDPGYGMGQAVYSQKSVEYSNGVLKLGIGALNDYSALEKGLAQIFGGKS